MTNRRSRNLDGTRIIANKQITPDSKKTKMFVGMDVHKKTIQVAAMDEDKNLFFNKKISNTHSEVRKLVKEMPSGTKYVMESSSVWYGLFCFMRDKLKVDVVLSNPYNTKIIATSLKKTDKIDAYHLANLLRMKCIAECYVPLPQIVEYRELTRARHTMVRSCTKMKNHVHGILLQNDIKIKSSGFTLTHIAELRRLGNYRIDMYLDMVEAHQKQINGLNSRIYHIVKSSPDISRLTTIPGVGNFSALVFYSEIGDISRFSSQYKLCAFAGIVPSVRNSADIVHHGRITKRGSGILRYVAVEAALSHSIHACDSNLTKFYKRLKTKRGFSKAKVAAGAKLLGIVYSMMKNECDYHG